MYLIKLKNRLKISSISANVNCIHSSHLFSHPLCKDQSLIKRVANVAFHVLTLGIPLAIYHVIKCCFPKSHSKHGIGNLQTVGVNSVQQNKNTKPYSALGQDALDYARKKLEEHPEIAPTEFRAGWYGPSETNQPVNPEIALLTTLYWDIAFKEVEDLMKQNEKKPWSNQEVINAADACMKITYAISNLTLDDLESFTEKLSSKGDDRTFAEALTRQDSFLYRTFFHCTNAYHWFRSEIEWTTCPYDADQKGLFKPKSISEAHSSAFYQKGTVQNSWNKLYNDYCDRVRLYVNKDELESADGRFTHWTKNDTGISSFRSTPDSQPT